MVLNSIDLPKYIENLKRYIKTKTNEIKTYTYVDEKKKDYGNIIERMQGKHVEVIFSHSNYLVSSGGTEKYITEQVQCFNNQGASCVQIFPMREKYFLSSKKAMYGINIDSDFEGYYSQQQIMEILNIKGMHIDIVYIHHLLYWQYADIYLIIKKLAVSNIKIIVYLHDFFCCCPNIFKKIINSYDEECCILSNADSMINGQCNSCIYFDEAQQWRKSFNNIFTFTEKIVVPSNYVFSIFKLFFPDFINKTIVWPHQKLIETYRVDTTYKNRKIKIAYLGVKAISKGWDVWEKVYCDLDLNNIYEFYHFGTSNIYSDNVFAVDYSFRKDGPTAVIDLLIKNEIDLVILWSIVPESYSYTLHEAIAAGIPVLTCSRSGNIADFIKNTGYTSGKVFKNDEELMQFLSDRTKVYELISHKRYRYNLQFNQINFD